PIKGRPPSLLANSAGCVFAPRCDSVLTRCPVDKPPLRIYSDGVEALCWREDGPGRQAAAASAAQASERAPIGEPVVAVENVHLTYNVGGFFGQNRSIDVLKGIDLTVGKGEIVGLVGESGCGKSSLARVIAGLTKATTGSVKLLGQDLSS